MLVLMLCVFIGVVSTDNEDEAKRSEEASDGEVQRRGGPGLWRGSQVHIWEVVPLCLLFFIGLSISATKPHCEFDSC